MRNVKKRMMMMRTILAVALVFFLGGCPQEGSSGSSVSQGPTAEARKAAIIAYFNRIKATFPGTDYFDIAPVTTGPNYLAGKLKNGYLQEALNVLNFSRFLAGLPDDVQLKDEYTNYAQHGMVILSALDKLTHYPTKPADMDQAFFDLGYKGTSNTNIASGYRTMETLSSAIIEGWLRDYDISNRAHLGHRRWCLNPRMGYTGFGQAKRPGDDTYTAMYSTDSSRPPVDYDAIYWPRGPIFPGDFFGSLTPWSITLNPEKYQTPKKDEVTVTVTELGTNKTWSYSKDHADNYFNVDTGGYGVANCIIFYLFGIYESGGYPGRTFQVEVRGLKTKAGASTGLTYTVEFFKLM